MPRIIKTPIRACIKPKVVKPCEMRNSRRYIQAVQGGARGAPLVFQAVLNSGTMFRVLSIREGHGQEL